MKTTKLINFTAVAMIILSLCMPLANDAHKPVHCCCHLWNQLDHHTEPREPFFPLVFSETSAASGFFEYKQVNGGETLSLLQYWCPSADFLLIIENLTGCVTGFDLVAAHFPVILQTVVWVKKNMRRYYVPRLS
ncbi:hypothetical protein [Acidithiobacillus thiooxidans]|uniref:Lipoprotein n=1 Tax=Acidithiobacillus thiooxidans ATCC 19377 TaxID=637390 RepID=A0A543PYK7_ACITH|nr:hypothetical protein [Acidithiobacillus thiooxidans]MDX5936790.1 hypothetical protein [Acidithiobacillus thiooxidans]MDX5936799.1 hypothetical protein [Acidithiobacillus thiooxidans]MDX5936808.1 hypothetical protein [Acidithiobacillus thiooxidans]TQN49152.1 hypothetical protein DLNHIDIE_03531 [Acidithiobacillus thiooxidans ATCC 19377]